MEIIAPAGTRESIVAAVQNGADAIYFTLGGSKVGQGDNCFSGEDVEYATRYCRTRGCKTYAALNTLVADDELEEASALARSAADLGVDAVIVQDIGLIRVMRRVVPDLPIIAGRRMGVENVVGAQTVAAIGASKVCLSRKLRDAQIGEIAKKAPIDTIVSVFSPHCISRHGACYMSALLDGQSANRGLCTGRCRLDYSLGGRKDSYMLSLRDNCLVDHLESLEKLGVSAIQIEGRARRPEYTAIVTGIFSRAVREGKLPTSSELDTLDSLLSDYGLTDGFYTGQTGENIFGPPREKKESLAGLFGRDETSRMFANVRKAYTSSEIHRVPLNVYAIVRAGQPVVIGAEDPQGRRSAIQGPPPEQASRQAITTEVLESLLSKTAGTPYYPQQIKTAVDPGVYVPAEGIREMWKRVISELTEKRMALPVRKHGAYLPVPVPPETAERPQLNFQVTSKAQITPELAALKPGMLYVPLELFMQSIERVMAFKRYGTEIAVILPPGIQSGEEQEVRSMLSEAKFQGVSQALINSLGHFTMANSLGFKVRGDFGLGVYNSYALKLLQEAGFLSATASFELSMSQAIALVKSLDTELIVYGRLPLMVMEHCVIKRSLGRHGCHNPNQLSDRQGSLFPVMREFGCRNVIYSPTKLYLSDKRWEYEAADFWGARLIFTTENPRECVEIAKTYMGQASYVPNGTSRGMYYAG